MICNSDVFDGLFHLDQIEEGVFLARTQAVGPRSQVYGGQIVAQALAAAVRTVPEDRAVHSLHSTFLAKGDPARPIRYEVSDVRDGGSFTTRSVVAVQGGQRIFDQSVSFHVSDAGIQHQIPRSAEGPPADSLPTTSERVASLDESTRAWWTMVASLFPLDIRFLDIPARARTARGERPPPRERFWVRFSERLGTDSRDHAIGLAYLSDLFMLATGALPHGLLVGPDVTVTSLDHSIWFHRCAHADEWLMHDLEASWAGGGRALVRGHLYDASGVLIATTMQEGLIRLSRASRDPSPR